MLSLQVQMKSLPIIETEEQAAVIAFVANQALDSGVQP
jgi:hypothetical protein